MKSWWKHTLQNTFIMWICLFFSSFFFFCKPDFHKDENSMISNKKKWMNRFSHDSNFIFLTNVLCSTSLYRYQIYLTLKWPPRSLRYGRHIIAWYSLIFFLCFEVRFLRPLSSFCCSSRSPSKNQLVEKAFFLSLI